MIFQQYRSQLLVVRQPDHGVQTGLFAQRWGNAQTPPFTPYSQNIQTPPDLVVKFQPIDIVDVILRLILRPRAV